MWLLLAGAMIAMVAVSVAALIHGGSLLARRHISLFTDVDDRAHDTGHRDAA